MKIGGLQKFTFNIAEGVDKLVINFNSNEVGDSVVPEVYLQVNGVTEGSQISAVGYVLKEADGIALRFADIANLGTADTIEADGIYLILSSPLERLELTANCDAELTIKQVI